MEEDKSLDSITEEIEKENDLLTINELYIFLNSIGKHNKVTDAMKEKNIDKPCKLSEL